MSNILNKSSHPVHVNRIPIRIWRFRDEIEKAVSIRMKEASEQGIELDISDLKAFYTRTKKDFKALQEASEDELEDDVDPTQEDSSLDSSGNEMDEDALAMMAAMNGDDDDSESDEEATDESQEPEEEVSEEDAEAARLAEMMLADQISPEENNQEIVKEETNNTLQRVIPDEDKLSGGFAFLSDMDMTKILSFSKTGFTIGQNICIEFLIPNGFIMTGEVVGSNHVGRNSKIISQMKPDYRIMTTFSFLFDNERDNLRKFLKSVEPDIPPPPSKLKRPSGEEEDDEFEDLGF